MREEFLANQLFEGISPESLTALDIMAETLEFDRGETIFREGVPGSSLYLVGTGTVRIWKGGAEEPETLKIIGPGQFIGEMAVIDGQARSASATAESPCLLGRIDASGFERLATVSPHITRNFVRTLVERLRATDDLLVRNLLIADRTSMIGRMTRSIVHDLRNPVQNILLAADFIAGHDESDALRQVSVLLEKSANRMVRMLQELLDFSGGKASLALTTQPLTKLVEALEEEVLQRLENKGITVLKQIRYEGPLRADHERLLRVLVNMIRNSDEAMATPGTLTLDIERNNDALIFGIADTGKGIPEASLAKIFEPFFTEGKANGTGIGMSMARSLIESHGGTITVSSQVGVGTTFTITLPLGGPP